MNRNDALQFVPGLRLPIDCRGCDRTLPVLVIVLSFVICLALLQADTQAHEAASQENTRTLTPGQSIDGQLRGGEAHSYALKLGAGQFFRVVLEQKGIDLTLTLYALDGRAVISINDAGDSQARETLALAIAVSGDYRLEVKSEHKWAAPGAYNLKFAELRVASGDDRVRSEREVKSLALMREGRELLSGATGPSWKQAGEKLNEALLLLRSLGDRPTREASTLVGLATSNAQLGELAKALAALEQALVLYRSAGDRWGEADALNNIGSVHYLSSDLEKSFASHTQALPLARAVGDRFMESEILNNIGTVHRMAGRMQLALDTHRLALPLREAIGDAELVANSNNNIGAVYFSLGEWQQAAEYFGRALQGWQSINNRPRVLTALSNLGAIHVRLKENEKALDLFQKALALAREIGDRRGQGLSLNSIGGVYTELGDYRRAADFLEQAIVIRRAINDLRGVGVSLHNAGAAYDELGEKEKALRYYEEALAVRRSSGDRNGEAITRYRIAGVQRAQDRLAEARSSIEQSLLVVESLRADINNRQLRASFFATVQTYYEFYVELLMQQHDSAPATGHAAEALAASERARARSLLDLMQEAGIDVRRDADPALVEHEAAVQAQLNKTADRQARLQGSKAAASELGAVARELEAMTTELNEVQARLRQSSPGYAALAHPKPLKLSEIQQQLLDSNTLLLEYKLGSKKSFLWLVSENKVLSYALPPRAEIEELARQVYSALTAPSLPAKPGESLAAVQLRRADAAGEYGRLASRLSEMILGPAAAQLENKRLVIVADGALQYIPFGALPVPKDEGGRLKDEVKSTTMRPDLRPSSFIPHPLVAEREIVSLPSASVLAELRREDRGRRVAEKTLAVFADPVFEADDPRIKAAVSKNKSNGVPASPLGLPAAELRRSATEAGIGREGSSGLPRLIATRQEAAAILASIPPAASLCAVDFEASRATAKNSELAHYRFIHFATHGLLNARHPELSGLVLSLVDREGQPIDGFLRLHEIYDLKLPAELVVLSACSTGLGKDVRGEGLIGLTRGFMYAGAPRVVASLWKVDDEATAELMAKFYRGMLKNNLRPAAALRAAQMEMLSQPQWRSPYYWAAFVLQGEWK